MAKSNYKFIIMNKKDNCATTLEDIPKGVEFEINNNKINITQKIPFGHKFALSDIKKGELVKKYGEIIGIATKNIKVGDWIHIHNIKSHYLEMVNN